LNDLETYLLDKERGYLATTGVRGAPTIVPVCFVLVGGRIYTMTDSKPKSPKTPARIKNIARRKDVAFLADVYSDDWRRLSFALVHCEASLLARSEDKEKAQAALVRKYPQYRWLGTRARWVISLTPKTWKLWSFT
jgi:PPOX class probable F420-dependent enzyme